MNTEEILEIFERDLHKADEVTAAELYKDANFLSSKECQDWVEVMAEYQEYAFRLIRQMTDKKLREIDRKYSSISKKEQNESDRRQNEGKL